MVSASSVSWEQPRAVEYRENGFDSDWQAWGSNVLVKGVQGFSQTIFWRFLFMVAAVLDNDNDFFEVRKKSLSVHVFTSPNRLVKIRHVNIQPAIDVNRYQNRTLLLQQTALSAGPIEK